MLRLDRKSASWTWRREPNPARDLGKAPKAFIKEVVRNRDSTLRRVIYNSFRILQITTTYLSYPLNLHLLKKI
ncbi:hypothetical protein HS1genome_1266 [Sulfodiicoccus acidiphilus]|uniref:Uncharacterized protein n=1 Tax=Sulfodiicoccus acidiphilus TaxID=1670455 RepID=A0A348B3X5_9CREN|nr:hypothetical protein [Sulfodiicoccus acidiphilus]BBD72877.1 hypothetical protein HS1genome_1266 [Sulfodiicoccus acidiphilus]GGT88305.1 hypothetical protein GCM10007116_02860 [Sulfodiicoccus acidiphilus]